MIRRTTKVMLEIVAVFLAGLAVGAAFLGWRLSTGAVSVDFLTPYVETALTSPDGGFTTAIDRTVLRWGGWDRPVQIRALGLRATDTEGRPIAQVPEATVQLSASELLTGRLVPTGLEVLNPRLRLTRTEEGRFVFGLEGGAQDDMVVETGAFLPRLLETLAIEDDRPHLTRLNIVGAHLTIEDHLLDASWTAPRADLSFERDTLGVEVSLSLELEGQGAPARFDGVALYDTGGQAIDLALAFENLDPAVFIGGELNLGPLRGFGARVGGTVSAGLTPAGAVRGVEFEVSAGGGDVELTEELGGRVRFTSMSARGRSRDGLGRIDIDEFRMTLAPAGGAAAVSHPVEEPSPPTVEGAGWLSRGETESILSASATLRDLPTHWLHDLWPRAVDPGSREWVLENITGGVIEEVSASLALRQRAEVREPEVLVLQGAARYAGLSIEYLDGLAPVTGVHGTASFDDETLVFDVSGGELEGMPVSDATVRIDGLAAAPQMIAVDAGISGPVPDMLAVLDAEPFGYARALGLDPQQIGGQAQGRIKVELPLLADLGFDDVELRGDGRIDGFAWKGALLGADVSDGMLDLSVTKQAMRVSGPLEIAGTPATIHWVETLAGDPALPQELTVESELGDATRAALGLDLGPHLRGPVPVTAVLRSNHRDRTEIEVEAELTRAALEMPVLGWAKEPGAQGQAHASVALGPDGVTRIERYDVATAHWSAQGRARLDPEGGLVDLDAELAHGPRNDATLAVETLEDGRRVVRLQGRAFDAGELIARMEEDVGAHVARSPTTGQPRVMMTGNVERLYLGGEGYMAGAAVNAAVVGGALDRLALRGDVGEAGRLAIEYGYDQAGREILNLETDDAGAALEVANVTGSVIGGTLAIAGADDPADDAPFRGTVRMEDFRVRDAPTLARLVSLSSLAGIADALSGQEGMGFSELTVPFTAEAGVVTIEAGRAIGPDLGFTGNGTLDLGADRIDLEGTVVPAYTLNSILGEIPILGDILVGEKGSGVFAATYSLRGPIDDPEISANPLAALTPGFLRGLFDVFKGPPPGTAETPIGPEDTPSPLD